MWLTVMLVPTVSVLHLLGIKPKLDGMPLIGWCHLLMMTALWCRLCVICYEIWNARQE